MFVIITGIIFILFCVAACMPNLLGWGPEIIAFLKGASPVLAAFIGLIAVFIGIADIKDKKEAKKEAAESTEKQE